jgi:mannose-6-phosphate isomerase-like protein (cupin superfamily)
MVSLAAEHKPWGLSELLIREPTLEVHRLTIQAGGYCSIHFHCHKLQYLFVVSGRLRLRTFTATGRLSEERECATGDCVICDLDIRHQFEAVTDCLVYEVYQSESLLDPLDIVRLSESGPPKKMTS